MNDETTDVKKREESLRTLQKRMESREATRQKLLAELDKLRAADDADVKAFNAKYRKKRTHIFCSLCPGLLTVLGLPKEDHSLEWLENTNKDVQYFIDTIMTNERYLNWFRRCYHDVLVHRAIEEAQAKKASTESDAQNNVAKPQD